jgi:autotransporter translocation and assembly factor TamB
MKKRIRQFLVGLGILLGLVCLLLFGAISYLKTNHAHRFILGKVNGAIPGTILCEGIRFSLLKGEFELEKMLIRGPSNEELAGFDRLFLDLSWATLLKSDVTVTALILEKPWTTLRVDSQGEINLMRAFAASRPEEEPQGAREEARGRGIPINVVIRSLKLAQGSFNYEMVAENLKAVGEEINITASGNLFERSGNLTFCIGKGRLDSPAIRTELDRFKLEAMLREGRIAPLVFEVGTPSSRLTLSGNISDVFSKPFLDVTLDLAVSLAELQESLHISQTLTGQVAACIAARGTADNPEVSVSLDYGGGMASAIQIDHIDLNCQMKDRLLTVDRFCVNAGSGDLNLEGTVDLHKAFANGFLAPQRDLEAISYKIFLKQKEIKLERLFPGANRLEGTVNSDLSVCGKGIFPQALSATLALRVFAEQVRASQLAAPIDCHLRTEASLDKGVARLKELRAEAGDINLRADCDFDLVSEEVAGRFTLDAPNLTGTLSSLGMPEVEGALGLDANVSGSMRQPVLDLALHGDRLRFQDITIGSVLLDAILDQSGMLRIVKLAVHNQKSRLLISGTAQILERERMQLIKDPTFQVTIRGSPIFAEDFVDRVKGKIVLTMNLEGSARHPKGKVELLGTGLDLGVQKLERLTLLCELDGEKIWVNPLQVVVVPGEIIEGTGWFSLHKSYQIDLRYFWKRHAQRPANQSRNSSKAAPV